jgi:quinoprotein glucose dehydrogenase
VTLTRNGARVDAVVQLTKQGLAFVFDRVTGTPIWPIEERAVPPSDVDGEKAWPTQPFPTKPAAFAAQGATLEDAFDFTPDLRAMAQAEMKKYRLGPIYTPPSRQGTLMMPGIIGGANWGGGAFDPETRRLYVKVSNQAAIARVVAPDRSPTNPRAGEVDANWVGDLGTSASFVPAPTGGDAASPGRMPSLPLLKPPYGELVAIALDSGDIAWRVPFGDTPSIRAHPLLKGVVLPDRLGAAGAPGVMVMKSGLAIGGGGDSALYAFDTTTGKELWRLPLQTRVTATPMTFRSATGTQFVVVATGSGANAALVALTVK